MSETKPKSSTFGKALKLLLLILLVLLIPLVMRECDVDPDTLKISGRFAVGAGGGMLLYGIVTKAMKAIAFVVLALLVGVSLISEGAIDAPRAKDLFSKSAKK